MAQNGQLLYTHDINSVVKGIGKIPPHETGFVVTILYMVMYGVWGDNNNIALF
jgi:hypothetical protein